MSDAPQRCYRPRSEKLLRVMGYNGRVPVPAPRSIPRSFSRNGRSGHQLGPVGARRPDRDPQPRSTGPPGCGAWPPSATGPPSPSACPCRRRRGSRPGFVAGRVNPTRTMVAVERAAERRSGVDRLVRGRRHPGPAVRHPLGRSGPRVLRRRGRRAAGSTTASRPPSVTEAGPVALGIHLVETPGVTRASCSTWPGPRGSSSSSPATRSPRPTSTPPAPGAG